MNRYALHGAIIPVVWWIMGGMPSVFGQRTVEQEQPPTRPWVQPKRVADIRTASACPRGVVRDAYQSIQVNVDRRGCNNVGDAANEPSMAVSATDPNKLAMAWREFATVASDFREAGHAYSHDGGHTWVFPGVIQPGVFRSDPVLDSAPDGTLYYFGVSYGPATFFTSVDGGRTWDKRG